MLARFDREIPGHGYTTVVILGGTNDVLLGLDPDITIRNLDRMAERAVQEKAAPILCEIPPIFHNFNTWDKKDYRPAVMELNRRITQLAAAHHFRLVDYYTPLADHPNFTIDGVHMNRRGYLAMEAALLRQLHPY
jgi:lysophospholipase L1-like esterase